MSILKLEHWGVLIHSHYLIYYEAALFLLARRLFPPFLIHVNLLQHTEIRTRHGLWFFFFLCFLKYQMTFFPLLTLARLRLTSPFSFLIRRLKSLPSRQIKSSPGWMMPHLAAMALAVLMLSPVTIRTVMPARWHLRMASGTWRQKNIIHFEDARRKHMLWDHRVSELLKTANVWRRCGTSGLTGSSMPTTVMQVNSVTISASLSHSGSGLDGKSRYAMQMVLRPSHAIGSITCVDLHVRWSSNTLLTKLFNLSSKADHSGTGFLKNRDYSIDFII